MCRGFNKWEGKKEMKIENVDIQISVGSYIMWYQSVDNLNYATRSKWGFHNLNPHVSNTDI